MIVNRNFKINIDLELNISILLLLQLMSNNKLYAVHPFMVQTYYKTQPENFF
jgi:hypothetical protein